MDIKEVSYNGIFDVCFFQFYAVEKEGLKASHIKRDFNRTKPFRFSKVRNNFKVYDIYSYQNKLGSKPLTNAIGALQNSLRIKDFITTIR